MSAPNILSLSTAIGLSTMVSIANTNTSNVILTNAASSGKVLKINSIIAANDNGSSDVDVTIKINDQAAGAGTSFSIGNLITVAAKSTLVLIGKDSPIYLEEDKSIIALASAADSVDIVCTYEQLS